MTEAEIASKMQEVGNAVAKVLPGVGFFVIAFPMNKADARGQYVSNARREDILRVMKNFVDRQPMQKPENN